MKESEYQRKHRNYGLGFLLFFFVLFTCWVLVLYYRFLEAESFNNSIVIASYLLDGDYLYQHEISQRTALTVVNIIVDLNLTIFGTTLGTAFLFYNLLPKVKNINYILLIIAFILSYVPSFFSIIKLFTDVSNNYYMTVSEFLLILVMYPLNYSLFFYFFYLIEKFFFQKGIL